MEPRWRVTSTSCSRARPWWWGTGGARSVAGVGNLAQHDADFEAYLEAHRRGAEAHEAARC